MAGVHGCFSKKKKELPERVILKYLTSRGINIQQAVKDLNREITISPQLEMGCESSGVGLEELRPSSLDENDSWRGSDSDGKDDNPEAYMQLYFRNRSLITSQGRGRVGLVVRALAFH